MSGVNPKLSCPFQPTRTPISKHSFQPAVRADFAVRPHLPAAGQGNGRGPVQPTKIAAPQRSGGVAAFQHVEGEAVEVFQDLVEFVPGLSSPAGRAAGTQRPVPMRPAADLWEMATLRVGVTVSFLRADRVATSPPAGEAFCLARQVVEG